jgi:hypothetical protein
MFDFIKIFDRHEIDAWRDEQTLAAAAELNEVAAYLACAFDRELNKATFKEILINPGNFIATNVDPDLRRASDVVVDRIVERANRSLKEIVAHQAVWNNIPREITNDEDSVAAIRDVAFAAGPIAGSLATAAALPTIGVTTTTAFFGLVTTTVISWPVIAMGATIAGAGLATGVLNASKIPANARERLRRKIHRHVISTLLQGSAKQPSVLEQLTVLFANTAAEAKKLS